MTKRTFEGAAAAAAGAETEFGIFLPDIARDAGIPLAALEAEVTAKRLPTFEGSFECGDPREYWSAGPVEIAVWLARPATPGDLRDRIAAWNETVFSPWRSVRQPAGGPRNCHRGCRGRPVRSSRTSPRSSSPCAASGTFGLPACGPPRQVFSGNPAATLGRVEKNMSSSSLRM